MKVIIHLGGLSDLVIRIRDDITQIRTRDMTRVEHLRTGSAAGGKHRACRVRKMLGGTRANTRSHSRKGRVIRSLLFCPCKHTG